MPSTNPIYPPGKMVLFLDGTTARLPVYAYEGAAMIGEPTAYVKRGDETVWVLPGASVEFVETILNDTVLNHKPIIDTINALPRGKATLFGPTVIRLLPNGRSWILVNTQEKGFASFGYEYPTLRKLMADWNVVVTTCGRDEHSFYYRIAPIRPAAIPPEGVTINGSPYGIHVSD